MTQNNTEIPEQVVGLFDSDTDSRPVIVSIRCITYNHEAYIRQTLDGFVMQNTNFRFEAIVHDDASTDGTAAIIREYAEKYPNIIKPIYETENQHSKNDGSLRRIMDAACRGKYIAYCEGDDYWTDPLKLQKQVDFLELHTEYNFCFHQLKKYKQNTGELSEFKTYPSKNAFNLTIELLLEKWPVQIQALLVSHNFYNEIEQESVKYSRWYDLTLFYYLIKLGKGIVLPDCMGVYRVHDTGISRASKFNKQTLIAYRELYLNNPNNKPTEKAYYRTLQKSVSYSPKLLFSSGFLKDLVKTKETYWKLFFDIAISLLKFCRRKQILYFDKIKSLTNKK